MYEACAMSLKHGVISVNIFFFKINKPPAPTDSLGYRILTKCSQAGTLFRIYIPSCQHIYVQYTREAKLRPMNITEK